jgi:molybdate transport system regulatory protein
MKPRHTAYHSPVLRFRILFSDKIALGPGKAELLRHVRETGSISTAAKRMHMSYMRAWLLIQEMNACFQEPVLHTVRGGSSRGGAQLTPTGEKLLGLFQRLETECLAASRVTRREIASLLRKRR